MNNIFPNGKRSPDQAKFERLLAQEREDDIVCAFGFDFFDGIRWSAGCGAILSFIASYRLYGDLSLILKAEDHANPHAYDFGKSAVVRGLRVNPYMTAGMWSFFLMGWTKLFKWYSASVRVNTFYMASFEFEEMRDSAVKQDPEGAKLFDAYCAELTKPSATLFRDAQEKSAIVTPTFSDGVAVGLFGSLFDSWLPTRPTSDYVGFAAGRTYC
jgi:hypothetical protein